MKRAADQQGDSIISNILLSIEETWVENYWTVLLNVSLNLMQQYKKNLAKDKSKKNRKTANVFLYELTGCASWGITKF